MDAQKLQSIVFDTVGFVYDGEIELSDISEGLSVSYDGKTAKIGYSSISTLCRAYFLFAKNYADGIINITEKQHFETCGVMLDASRNGVMKVEAVKKFMNYMASLGLNMLMLYTEDTFEVPEYPLFGYMRGRYSAEELREIDRYGKMMGIEVIPCIQTLAHLGQFLKYNESSPLKDIMDILLVDEEETYRFIECEIKAVAEAFSSKRVHIGMDEAFMLGRGAFLNRHGKERRFSILTRHLERVVGICKKYDLKPMMWHDMFFRSCVPSCDYYRYKDVNWTDEMLSSIPDVDMVYWDYHHSDKETYDGMIEVTERMNKEIVFAGGLQTWYGFTPNYSRAVNNSIPALKSCLEHSIKTVFATMWGDDGNECNVFLALPYLAIYSEYCYKGFECTVEDIKSAGEYLGKYSWDAVEAMGRFSNDINNNTMTHDCKNLFYADVMYDLGIPVFQCENIIKRLKEALPVIEKYLSPDDVNYESYLYTKILYEIAIEKADLRIKLRKAYAEGDKKYLCLVANEILPALKEKYITFKRILKKQWHSTYKQFGFETLSLRIGSVVYRLDDVVEDINSYLAGETEHLEALEEKVVPYSAFAASARSSFSPSTIT